MKAESYDNPAGCGARGAGGGARGGGGWRGGRGAGRGARAGGGRGGAGAGCGARGTAEVCTCCRYTGSGGPAPFWRAIMRKSVAVGVAVALAAVLTAGCDLLSKLKKDTSSSPTSPTPTVSMDVFAGTWSSVTASTPSTGCGNLKYTVIPLSDTNANVTFAATCGGNINVTGSGAGTLSGSTLNWSAT